ncbi:diadenosine 5',5'''-P1,P4-tetraphosphate asymmetrical hydrolase [Coprinopsis marcescibilis]|uniref:Diadenosine 5',5'''-P1,P4-tetraphosphate asymmetrical hydrolase n=1 Tax=Coprinopsis marcescibilis TaxID=230819 RepID=A0A5C3LBP8_COPMA|nr:diadenosine 5',5'''-P1,P4-tetraphosphate asymmetrical hydrolase [Coprinopsis marcescibilis]
MSPLLFSTIEVTAQSFYRTALSYAIVNLKPIVPGHVLVIPTRPVPRLADLNDSELASLMRSVNRVGTIVEHAYGADALTIACQDGKSAGQSVPHVHFHILPRKSQGDRFSDSNDAIYPELETSEAGLSSDIKTAHQPLKVDADDHRPPRTIEEMVKEAAWLKGFFSREEGGSADID